MLPILRPLKTRRKSPARGGWPHHFRTRQIGQAAALRRGSMDSKIDCLHTQAAEESEQAAATQTSKRRLRMMEPHSKRHSLRGAARSRAGIPGVEWRTQNNHACAHGRQRAHERSASYEARWWGRTGSFEENRLQRVSEAASNSDFTVIHRCTLPWCRGCLRQVAFMSHLQTALRMLSLPRPPPILAGHVRSLGWARAGRAPSPCGQPVPNPADGGPQGSTPPSEEQRGPRMTRGPSPRAAAVGPSARRRRLSRAPGSAAPPAAARRAGQDSLRRPLRRALREAKAQARYSTNTRVRYVVACG